MSDTDPAAVCRITADPNFNESRFQDACRICMECHGDLVSIFKTTENHIKSLAEMLTECTRHKVVKDDKLPKNVCQMCMNQVQDAYALKYKAEESYKRLCELYCKGDVNTIENESLVEKGTQTETLGDVKPFKTNEIQYQENETKDNYNCQLCDKFFGQLADLRRHMLKEHTNSQPDIPCPICQKTFGRKDHMKRHVIKKHNEDPNKYLITLKKEKTDQSFECPICSRVFAKKNHLKRHVAFVHKEDAEKVILPEETAVCIDQESEVAVLNDPDWNDDKHFLDKNPFASDSESENEEDSQHKKGSTLENSIIIKEEPNDDFHKPKEENAEKMVVNIELSAFKNDLDNDDNDEDNSDYDDKGFTMPDFHEDDNDSDDESEEKGKKPTVQGKNMLIFAEEGKPIKRKRGARGDGTPEERTCVLCQRLFSRLCHLRRHMQSAHTQQKPHSCPHCEKCFSRSDHLKNHVEGVHAERIHKCDMCEKCFARADALQRHKEARHGDSSGTYRIHECEFCGRKFTGKSYLARHRLLHTDRIYACRFCEETFKDRKLFREHERSHKSVERNFLCSICGDSFVRNDYLRIHMRRHLGEKPYKCQFCGKGFPRATDLKVHERYHTNTKPSVCQICGKAFHRAYNLTIHMRIHTGEKPYKCEHCSKCFAQSNDLKAHVRRHTGERYKCEQCDASFLQLYGLRQHALSAHGTHIESSTGRLQKVGILGSTNVATININDPTAADTPCQTNGAIANPVITHKPVELLNLSGSDTSTPHQHALLPVQDPLQSNEIQQQQIPIPAPMALIYPNVSAADIFKAQQFMQLK